MEQPSEIQYAGFSVFHEDKTKCMLWESNATGKDRWRCCQRTQPKVCSHAPSKQGHAGLCNSIADFKFCSNPTNIEGCATAACWLPTPCFPPRGLACTLHSSKGPWSIKLDFIHCNACIDRLGALFWARNPATSMALRSCRSLLRDSKYSLYSAHVDSTRCRVAVSVLLNRLTTKGRIASRTSACVSLGPGRMVDAFIITSKRIGPKSTLACANGEYFEVGCGCTVFKLRNFCAKLGGTTGSLGFKGLLRGAACCCISASLLQRSITRPPSPLSCWERVRRHAPATSEPASAEASAKLSKKKAKSKSRSTWLSCLHCRTISSAILEIKRLDLLDAPVWKKKSQQFWRGDTWAKMCCDINNKWFMHTKPAQSTMHQIYIYISMSNI